MKKLENIDYRITSILTAEQAHTFRVIPIHIHEEGIDMMGDELANQKKPHIQVLLGKKVSIEPISQEILNRYLIQYYPHEFASKPDSKDSISTKEESDIVRFVHKILEEAAQMSASDIHIERYEKEARIRFRWEGHLIEKYEIPLLQYNAIISRIKILAELDISERRLTQDGRIHLQLTDQDIDIRVSTIPGKYGEKIVMRLLTRSQDNLDLKKLGLSQADETAFQKSIRRPNGIILITGPTGSGKTTTLYATLSQLNQPDKNIVTIEDPIEYNLSGINQVQLKEEIGLSFDRTLRAFLRQDPDIIMIGEIRDVTTANIAIRAALTGHLVFSTLHTNSSWDAITRLTDMGLEPYLLAASLRMVVAQRLVRVLCQHCKMQSSEIIFPDIQKAGNIEYHFIPNGCAECYYTGYRNRKAVFEVLPVTPVLKDMIKRQEGEIQKYLKNTGIRSLSDHLLTFVQTGVTSLEEAIAHWES
ncbi:MAG: GspE/PulE family protein [Bacteroidia bacterium]